MLRTLSFYASFMALRQGHEEIHDEFTLFDNGLLTLSNFLRRPVPAVGLCAFTNMGDLLVGDSALEAAEPAESESVPRADLADLASLFDSQFLAYTVILVAAFQCQRHCLGHARIRHLR